MNFAGVPFDLEQNCETFVNFGGTRAKFGGYLGKVRGGIQTKCEKKNPFPIIRPAWRTFVPEPGQGWPDWTKVHGSWDQA